MVQPSRKAASTSGRDSGAAKAVAQKQARNHKKNAMVDKFNENRDNETVRLSQKRAMVHAEEMGRLENKKLKLEIELLKLKNEGLAAAALLRRTPVTPLHHAHRVSNQPNVGLAFPPGHAAAPPAFIPALVDNEAEFPFVMDGVTFGLEPGFLDMLNSPLIDNDNTGPVAANNHVSTL